MIYWVKNKHTGRAIHTGYFDNLDQAKLILFNYVNKNPKNQGDLGVYDLNNVLVFELNIVRKNNKKNNNFFGV
jgi:hypothetical protein